MSPLLQNAIQLHRSGQFDQAEQIYRQILGQDPNEADALHLLGVLAQQRGNARQAIELIGQAVALRPRDATYRSNLAEAYRSDGDPAQAASQAQAALQLKPDFAEAYNNYGLALMDQRKFTEALAQFRRALAINPGFALAALNQGNALRELGELPEALDAYRAAARLGPQLPQAHTNLGQLLLETNHEDEALFHCNEAVRLSPEFAEGLSNLGNALRKKGRVAEAKACYVRAIQLRPNLAMPYNNMGQAVQEEGDLPGAFRWYDQALQREPRTARFHCNYASALHELEQHDDALIRYRMAIDCEPNYAEAYNGMGFVHEERGDHEQALAAYREAIRLKPDLGAAHTNMGQVYMQLGEMDQALECFREAIRREPDSGDGQAGLLMVEGAKVGNEHVTMLERLLSTRYLRPRERSSIELALAHVYDARGDYALAGIHAREGNAHAVKHWRRRHGGYDPDEHRQFVDQLIAAFTPQFFESVKGLGSDSELPTFVLGLPRSGTTLTEQVLASHPRVFGAGELRLVKNTFDAIPAVLNTKEPALACLPRLDSAALAELARRHIEALRQLHPSADRIVDKMPDNYLWIGLIQTVFPRAKIIHVRRDLRDIAVSCWMTNFKWIQWANHMDHIANRFEQYLRVMAHWRQVLPYPILEFDYEELVADSEKVSRRLIDFVGLEWDPVCLEPHKNKRPVRTASVTQVRQPIYTKSVERWRKYEATLRPLFERLTALSGSVAGP